MKPDVLTPKPLTVAEFAAYGDIVQMQAQPTVIINQGNCRRYTDLAKLDFSDGRAGISVFHADLYHAPLSLPMLERHPLGSQAFLPMSEDPFLVIVAGDENGSPGRPIVFMTDGYQGVNYHRNTWHGVLSPIGGNGLFTVVDRLGTGDNLEEHWFVKPYCVEF